MEVMELRIKNTEDELTMAHGGLLKWIDPDVMTGHNKCCQKRTTIRNIRRLCTTGALWRTHGHVTIWCMPYYTNTHDVRPTHT